MNNNNEVGMLAEFRVHLRQFNYFSEQQCAALGLTSQHYQALLAIKGHPGLAPITITELAQQMVIKHNSAVGMVDRLAKQQMVRRHQLPEDRRRVGIELTRHGEQVFGRLVKLHRGELRRMTPGFRRYFNHFAKAVDGA